MNILRNSYKVNYVKNYQEVRRGDYTNVHVNGRTPTSLMTGNMKYQAYQTAYFIIGFLIQVKRKL